MALLKNEEPHCPRIDFTYRLIEFLGQGILGLLSVISKIKFSTKINDSIALIIRIIILFREEIISFIYMALKCESYTLFLILKSETLDLEISNFFVVFEELYVEKDGNINSYL